MSRQAADISRSKVKWCSFGFRARGNITECISCILSVQPMCGPCHEENNCSAVKHVNRDQQLLRRNSQCHQQYQSSLIAAAARCCITCTMQAAGINFLERHNIMLLSSEQGFITKAICSWVSMNRMLMLLQKGYRCSVQCVLLFETYLIKHPWEASLKVLLEDIVLKMSGASTTQMFVFAQFGRSKPWPWTKSQEALVQFRKLHLHCIHTQT